MLYLDNLQPAWESFGCSFAHEVTQLYSVISVKKSFLFSLQYTVTSPINQAPKHQV